jgi:hypothetical protein
MLVLTATNELQGATPGDYCYTVAGELVTALTAQCGDAERCGCSRGFPGFASHRATTTAMVTDLPHLSEHDLRGAVYDHLERSGWVDLLREQTTQPMRSHHGHDDDPDDDLDDSALEIDELIDELVDEHLDVIAMICERFAVGTIVERSGTLVRARSFPLAA